MLVNKSFKKLHEDIKINSNNSTIKAENFMKIDLGMTSWECYENKWFYMKYRGNSLSGEILLTRECLYKSDYIIILPQSNKRELFFVFGTDAYQIERLLGSSAPVYFGVLLIRKNETIL